MGGQKDEKMAYIHYSARPWRHGTQVPDHFSQQLTFPQIFEILLHLELTSLSTYLMTKAFDFAIEHPGIVRSKYWSQRAEVAEITWVRSDQGPNWLQPVIYWTRLPSGAQRLLLTPFHVCSRFYFYKYREFSWNILLARAMEWLCACCQCIINPFPSRDSYLPLGTFTIENDVIDLSLQPSTAINCQVARGFWALSRMSSVNACLLIDTGLAIYA